jgi:alpha-amylase/alpha-mannosidase (GH57 family)
LLGQPISPVVPLSFKGAPNARMTSFYQMTHMPVIVLFLGNYTTKVNPLYMYYTLWNYLYVTEGSDWTFQAGPPNYGPAWFAKQPIIYDNIIDNYIENEFSQVVPQKVFVSNKSIVGIIINNSLGTPFNISAHLTVVINNGTKNVSENIIAKPGISTYLIYGLTSYPGEKLTIYLYSQLMYSKLEFPLYQYQTMVS